jgi:hypothetical protein
MLQLLGQQADVTVFFFNNRIDSFNAGRVSGEVFQAPIEKDSFFRAPDGILEYLLNILPAMRFLKRSRFVCKYGKARHHVGIGQDIIIGIESPEFTGFFGESFSSLGEDLFVPGLPRGQLVADIADFHIIEQFRCFKIELGAVMFDLFGDLENLKDVKFCLHYSTFTKKPYLSTGGRAIRCQDTIL